MASASRSPDAPSSLSLSIEHWSAVLDSLRESLLLFDRRPDLVDEPIESVARLYHSLAERVESRVAVGDSWDRVVAVPLSSSEADCLTSVLAVIESLPTDAALDDPLPDADAVADRLDPSRAGR
ncbi:hypothetical protein [Halospeciosus flavus]|uniref:Uncharacterized protein n=1 Tax=Halospeciosus flavus TaxID=3032283 RepID=A0ABD5YVR6_9EURY|nr:hypothetical protein [Halospeciosus flavus]